MLTEYYERNGIERLHLDYILKAPFVLEVNEEKYERRRELTRRLKNASMSVLIEYRRKNNKPKFNEILKNIIENNKKQKKAEKARILEMMNRMNRAEEEKQENYINESESKQIHDFLVDMEK